MSEYDRQQRQAITAVNDCLQTLSRSAVKRLQRRIQSYLHFRAEVDDFVQEHFSATCTRQCYDNQQSACCNREGITTFFADVVVNILISSPESIQGLLRALDGPSRGLKCVYLGENGCLWQVKPIVCEMFFCQRARQTVFGRDASALAQWRRFRRRQRRYTWPSRPVLFDFLESYFMEKDLHSPLMYCHNSPGLLRVKARAQKKRSSRSPLLRQ